MLRSPQRSARKYASALELSDCTVGKILHDDFHFHPPGRKVLLEVVPPIFICVDTSTNKTCATWLTPILENCIIGLCMHLKSQCGVQFPQLELLIPGSLRKMTSQ